MPIELKTHVVYPIKCLVVTGELDTGFTFFGPFDGLRAAGEWATRNLRTNIPYRVHNFYDVRGR